MQKNQHPQTIFSEDQRGNNLNLCIQKPSIIFSYTFPNKTLYKFLNFPCVLYTPSPSTWAIFRVVFSKEIYIQFPEGERNSPIL